MQNELFFPENKRIEWVERPTLMRRIRDALVKNKNFLGFFSAPGGYGKTVAIIQFLSGVRGPKYWLTVTEADNEPSRFYGRLVHALCSLTGKEPSAPASGHSLETLLAVIDALPDKNRHGYVALDDFHMLRDEELLSRLPMIFSRMPGWITLLATSRSDLPAGLKHLPRTMTVFTQNDLLFTLNDAKRLYEIIHYEKAEKSPGHMESNPKKLESLYAESCGWALGLYALLLDGEVETSPEQSRTPGQLSEYLDSRVWKGWDGETRDILVRLSVAETLTPELASLLTGQKDGGAVLAMLERLGAFLSRTGEDRYRFHDLFLHYLRRRGTEFLSEEERGLLLDIAADHAYEQGQHFDALRYYIKNKNFGGIDRCLKAANRYGASLPLESRYHFFRLYVNALDEDFILKSPYLLDTRVWLAWLDSDTETFSRCLNALFEKLPEFAPVHPELVESEGFLGSLDFNVPVSVYGRRMLEMMGEMPPPSPGKEALSSDITHNLPYLHRSMRDFSEYHALEKEELTILRNTFGVMIGHDYPVMESCLISGIYYEKNDLINAVRHATEAYLACDDTMQVETVFSANMILAAVLAAMNDVVDADRIYAETEAMISTDRASFLRPNFRGMQVRRAMRNGGRKEAKEWLDMYAPGGGRLPFYQICRHFTTLRAYSLLGEYERALDFGKQLHKLAVSYNRPLDIIESGILLAIALWGTGEQDKALRCLESAIKTAMLYGFTRLFVNEGRALLPLLLGIKEAPTKSKTFLLFVDRLLSETYSALSIGKETAENKPHLTPRMREILSCLTRGMNHRQIMESTGMLHATVKYHITQLYKAMGVSNARDAVEKARMLGIAE